MSYRGRNNFPEELLDRDRQVRTIVVFRPWFQHVMYVLESKQCEFYFRRMLCVVLWVVACWLVFGPK